MDIKGRDPATESYRVVVDVDGQSVMALVPEYLAADLRQTGARPSHQDAYEWMAEQSGKIEASIAQLARGGPRPRAPFDQITLMQDT